jgi:hypothetical protein
MMMKIIKITSLTQQWMMDSMLMTLLKMVLYDLLPKVLSDLFLMQHINIKFYLFKVINSSNSSTFFSILQFIVVLEMI